MCVQESHDLWVCHFFFHACLPLVPPTLQKEKKVNVKSEQGSSIVLKCNPPQSSMEPIIHWMDWSEYITFPSLLPLHPSCLISLRLYAHSFDAHLSHNAEVVDHLFLKHYVKFFSFFKYLLIYFYIMTCIWMLPSILFSHYFYSSESLLCFFLLWGGLFQPVTSLPPSVFRAPSYPA